MRLDGKRAIVTGGTAGIGLATVRILSELGGTGAGGLPHRARTPCRRACSTWRPTSPSAGAAVAIADGARELLGGADVLVNNAAQDHTNLILDTSDDEIDAVLAVNLAAPIRVTREVARLMVEQGTGGSIINLSSRLGHDRRRDDGHLRRRQGRHQRLHPARRDRARALRRSG